MEEIIETKREETRESTVKRDEKGLWLPGTSPNPAGRPAGSISITALVASELDKVPELKGKDGRDVNPEKKKWIQLFVDRMMAQAIATGDRTTQRMIWNYIDGLPKGSFDVTSGGKPITIEAKQQAKEAIDEYLNGLKNKQNSSNGETRTDTPTV